MKSLIIIVSLLLLAQVSDASIVDVFKDEEGRTKWQHVANFSGSVLIILLSIAMSAVLVGVVKLRGRNSELSDIKSSLEITVRRRTENLDKSNRLLQESNEALAGEIGEHKQTTELLQSSQNYLNSILASMPSMLIGLNEKMEITHWNQTAESITGHSAESVAGVNLWQAYPTITLSPEQVRQVLDDLEPMTIKHSQRGQYYFDITVYPLSNDNGGVVVVVENVTQRSLAENMLIQRDKMASMGEFASTMAHDISMPLKGILEDVQIVNKHIRLIDAVPENTLALLQDALDRGRQASAVISNLLEFSNQSANTSTEKLASPVTDIIDHCIELANDMLSDNGLHFRNIIVEKNYAESLPDLQCHIAELQQLFLSLFRHACRAMSEKLESGTAGYKPTLVVDVSQAYDAVWVKVQHNGIGLTIEEQQDLFEPIVQQTTPVNPKPLVAENRLSFCYFIVTEHHDGELAVTSDVSVGSTFHIQFQLGQG